MSRQTLFKIIFFSIFALSLTGWLYFSSKDHIDPIEYSEPYFIEDWTVTSPYGNVSPAGSSYWSDGSETGSFTMTTRLPENITDGSCFCLMIGGDFSVRINGRMRKNFYAERDIVIPGGCVKRFYMRIPLTSDDAGAEVKLIRYGTTRSGYIYQNTMVADEGAFFMFMMSHYGLAFILDLLLMIFSVVIVAASLLMTLVYRRRIEMLYGAMAIFVVSGWLITNSFLYPFIFGHYHVDGFMNYMFCLMMPFNIAFYLDALQHGRYRKIMRIVLYTAMVNLIVWPVLHLTGLFKFSAALTFISSIIGIELLIVTGIMISDTIRGGIKEYTYTAVGFAGFFICGLIEIVSLNFTKLKYEDVFMRAGLAILMVLMVIQQIADLRKVREEGQKALDLSEAKTQFLASMSHEIRTPINAILGMNEMILRENKDPVIADYADSVKNSGQMLLMLVNDVLDFSKIEAGKMDINEAEFTMSLMLHNIMPMIRERAGEKNLTLDVKITDRVPDGLLSDEFRIRQILINLLNNAIKYTDAGSVELILCGQYSGEDTYDLRMSVRDTGRGISKEAQKHLFEAFSRADLKENRSIEGTGLGLAIVKRILDSMDGSITVDSTYGEGSEFIVRLPVKVTDRTPLDEDYEKNINTAGAENSESDYRAPEASVLAVDDNSANLRIVSLFLKRVGIVPELCKSGTEAIELCKEKQYDLLLLDHRMPDPDGIKTLEIIRSDGASQNKETPAVVLTANAIAGSDKIYKDAGFIDYLTKPIDSSLLERTVRKYLPDEKILPAEEIGEDDPDVLVFKAVPDAGDKNSGNSCLRDKLEQIEGLDYDKALSLAGGHEDLLQETVGIIASECDEKIDHMRECIASQDWKGYELITHSIKGLMASLGLKELSDRARKHENAAMDLDVEFIRSDCDSFIEAYREVCTMLRR